MERRDSTTIVFIHGLCMTPKCWQHWKAYFEALGYEVHAPAYPFHDGNPKKLWKNINPLLGEVNLDEVILHLSSFIEKLPEKPVLVGHSLGGLIVQKLMARDKGVAGIVISGTPPLGIITFKWSFWKSNIPLLNIFTPNSIFKARRKWFHFAFGNLLEREDSDEIYDRFVVPESRRIARGSFSSTARINFEKSHRPLLFIAAEKDNSIPFQLVKKNLHAYEDILSAREYRIFPGRSHLICLEQNWQQVADYVQQWLQKMQVSRKHV